VQFFLDQNTSITAREGWAGSDPEKKGGTKGGVFEGLIGVKKSEIVPKGGVNRVLGDRGFWSSVGEGRGVGGGGNMETSFFSEMGGVGAIRPIDKRMVSAKLPRVAEDVEREAGSPPDCPFPKWIACCKRRGLRGKSYLSPCKLKEKA